MVLNRPIHNAYPNRYAQQIQTWQIHNAYSVHHIHDTLRRQQILSLCPIYHLPRTYPLRMFFLPRQPPPTMGQTKTTAIPKRLTYRNIHPTRQPHSILLAHQRKQFHPPHNPILYSEPHIRICLHILSKIPKQDQKPHHNPNLHWHNANLRPSQNDDWRNRLRNREDHTSHKHYIRLGRMPHNYSFDRNYDITHYHLQQ